MGLSENSVPLHPMVNDYSIQWIWGYTIFRQTHMMLGLKQTHTRIVGVYLGTASQILTLGGKPRFVIDEGL